MGLNEYRCPTWYWKERFDSEAKAQKRIEQLERMQVARNPLVAYRCQSSACGGWHVGHKTGGSLERMR